MAPATPVPDAAVEVWVAEHPAFPGYLDPLVTLAEAFTARYPGRPVRVVGCDFRRMPQLVADAAARGTAPALAEYYYTASASARDTTARDGTPLFTSVSRVVAGRRRVLDEDVALLDDVHPVVRGYYSRAGDMPSVPMSVTMPLLYSDLDTLGDAGIAHPPRTLVELREAAEKIVAEHPDRAPLAWPVHGWLLQQVDEK